MLKHIKKILGNLSNLPEKSIDDEADKLQFAVAILLVEIMHADHHLDEQEEVMVIGLLQQQFELDEVVARSLFYKASQKMQGAVSLHQYTSCINNQLSHKQKLNFMVNLWKVVYSDGQVDKYEEHLIRRVADLIHVGHGNFIKAKHIAQDTLAC